MFLIGIDDTDNDTSRGTGYRARCLGDALAAAGLGTVGGITRHQLLVDDAIPYTSHNSSACLSVAPAHAGAAGAIWNLCREFLLREAAPGSDAGLCLATPDQALAAGAIGRDAQSRVLKAAPVQEAARNLGLRVEGLTGEKIGVIGAIAAVGLHASGSDGRYIWARNVRELAGTVLSLHELIEQTGVESARSLEGFEVSDPAALIELGPWPRPVRIAGKAVLLVERSDHENVHWQVVDKQIIKSFHS